MLVGNFVTEETASLKKEAQAINPSICLPQENPSLVDREMSKDLHACLENAMDVLDVFKTKVVT
jgi:hypothetical protein